ncbi:hypothetical protein B5V02_08335 [Mesorhizobium kowhaii]|uniref:Uncharacterized protein n=1 Tax=Mesorhizobium kowhaii TaxID=1300272 RepID=A0A2W7C9M6_9HYPH|nr:hypothetical protein B5V02_08335 [Mesorhizobium kowhaii]
MIQYAISTTGEKPYLVELRTSFDHGYNHADRSVLSFDELTAFRDAAAKYTRQAQWKREGLADCQGRRMEDLLDLTEARLKQLTVC